MEKALQIATQDKHFIHGILNSTDNSKKVIIFVHGLTGHKNEHQFFNAPQFFLPKGFDTFRFDLHSGEEKGRKLIDCTIHTHASDLEHVINYFSKKYSSLYIVGHSLGGPTILLADLSLVKSVVLWDPSYEIFKGLEECLRYEPDSGNFILSWGVEYLLSREMVDSWKYLGKNLIDRFQIPTKIVCAGKGELYKSWQKQIEHIKVETQFHIIKNAGHCFDEAGTEKELFTQTLNWFTRK